MEVNSRWHQQTTDAIHSYRSTLGKKEQKKYKLDLLERLSRRVAEFSPQCGQCQIYQQEITAYLAELGNLVQMNDKTRRRYHTRKLDRMVKHLQSQHNLVPQGYYIGIWIGIGTAIGVAIGAGMDSVGMGIPIGTAIGTAIGMFLDSRAKKEDRVI
jgi:hypothetical protein